MGFREAWSWSALSLPRGCAGTDGCSGSCICIDSPEFTTYSREEGKVLQRAMTNNSVKLLSFFDLPGGASNLGTSLRCQNGRRRAKPQCGNPTAWCLSLLPPEQKNHAERLMMDICCFLPAWRARGRRRAALNFFPKRRVWDPG